MSDSNPKMTSLNWGTLGKITLAIVAIIGALVLLSRFGSDDIVSPKNRVPVASPQAGRSAASISVGDVKRIRVGNPSKRSDMPIFTTKEALIKFLRAVEKNDSDGMLATLPDTFRVGDYTRVQVIDYEPLGDGLFNVKLLEGPQKGRMGWVIDIDLRD